jgi:hypothetical protein
MDSAESIVEDLGVLIARAERDGDGDREAPFWADVAAVRAAAASASAAPDAADGPQHSHHLALRQADALMARVQASWRARLAAMRQGVPTTAGEQQQNPLTAADADNASTDAAVAAQSDELQRDAAREVRDALAWARTLLFQRLADALDEGGDDDGDGHNHPRWSQVRALSAELARLDGTVVSCAPAGAVERTSAPFGQPPPPPPPDSHHHHRHHHRRHRGGCCSRRRRRRRHRRGRWDQDDDDSDDLEQQQMRAPLADDDDDRLSVLSDDDAAKPQYPPAGRRHDDDDGAAPPTAVPPPSADARAKERAASRLLDLQEAAMRAAHAELLELWPSVEATARAHARALAEGLGAALGRRAARLQQAKGGAPLPPPPPPPLHVDPALPPDEHPLLPIPSSEAFAVDLEALLASALAERHERLLVSRETTAWQQQQQQRPEPSRRSSRGSHRCCLRRVLCRLLYGDEEEEEEEQPPCPPSSYAPPLQPFTTRSSQAFDAAVVRVDADALRAALIAAAEAGCAAAERAAATAAQAHAAGHAEDAAAQSRALVEAAAAAAAAGTAQAGPPDAAERLEARCDELAQLRARVWVALGGEEEEEVEDEGRSVRATAALAGSASPGAPPRPPSVDLLMADAPPPPPPRAAASLVAANEEEEQGTTEEGDVAEAGEAGADWEWEVLSAQPPSPPPTA